MKDSSTVNTLVCVLFKLRWLALYTLSSPLTQINSRSSVSSLAPAYTNIYFWPTPWIFCLSIELWKGNYSKPFKKSTSPFLNSTEKINHPTQFSVFFSAGFSSTCWHRDREICEPRVHPSLPQNTCCFIPSLSMGTGQLWGQLVLTNFETLLI